MNAWLTFAPGMSLGVKLLPCRVTTFCSFSSTIFQISPVFGLKKVLISSSVAAGALSAVLNGYLFISGDICLHRAAPAAFNSVLGGAARQQDSTFRTAASSRLLLV